MWHGVKCFAQVQVVKLPNLCLSVPMISEHACPGMVVGSAEQHETVAQ